MLSFGKIKKIEDTSFNPCLHNVKKLSKSTLKSTFDQFPTLYMKHYTLYNSFHANVPFLYPLKTSENQRFSDVFRGIEMGHWPKRD